MLTLAREIPQWQVSRWFNTPQPLTFEELRGSVVVICAFQMLCPGCVAYGIPQAKAIDRAFPRKRVRVVGLHTVFEHHEAMNENALQAFLQEYAVSFPVGVDQPDSQGQPMPVTMKFWHLQGTPTLIILDAEGKMRLNHFGRIDDLLLGAVLGQLLAESDAAATAQ